MVLALLVFLASATTSTLAQFYPNLGVPAVGYGPPGVRFPGSMYPTGVNYYPGYLPIAPQPFSATAMGAATAGVNPPLLPSPLPMPMSTNENANENANTNVNINAGSYRRSLHLPSKETSGNRNSNSNTNANNNLNS